MAHIRDQIVDELVTRFGAIAGYSGKVYKNRVQTLPADFNRALVVRAYQEDVDYSQGMLASTPQHVLTVQVDSLYKQLSVDIFENANDGLVEVEKIIYDGTTLATLAQAVELGAYESEVGEEGDDQTARATQEFIIYYYAQEGAPETAIT